MSKALNILTSVWGPGHIEWMERACIRSLRWPKNNAAIKEATWHIFTRAEDTERVVDLASKVGVKEIRIGELPAGLQGTPPQMGLILLQVLLHVMDDCLKNNRQMLMAPPDTIFSEGSIPNLIQAGRFGDTCVAVPHARVNASIFGGLKNDSTSGAELVDLIFKHQHKAWSGAEIGIENQSTFIGGIAWEKMKGTEKTWSVQHMLPTIYLANFIPADVIFFQTSHDGSQPVLGAYDHLWPSSLMKDQRQRWIGSSDAACIAEVTKEDLNIPAKVEVNPFEPDNFWRGWPHNKQNRQCLYIMRGT